MNHTNSATTPGRRRVATGVAGLDDLLHGGLPSQRIYLVNGGPGVGKTTLGFQFLLEGADQGESVLYVSLLQTREELADITESHGWDLDKIHLLELPEDAEEALEADQTVFSPAEVELDEVTGAIVGAIEKHQPRRMVLDSLSELRILVDSPYQMRRQLIKLKRALLAARCTTIMTAGRSVIDQHPTYQTIVHGSIDLTLTTPDYGAPRRQLEVKKIRGILFAGGVHEMRMRTGGLEVFPRLPSEPTVDAAPERVASGNEQLDALFGGGLDRGSTCLITGGSGAGKSTLTSLYAAALADLGERSVIFCFDESRQTYLRRARGLGLSIPDHVERGTIDLRHYDVGRLTPGRLMADLREDVERRETKLVAIDSLTGFYQLMPNATQLAAKLHEILHYLTTRGVLVLIPVNEQNLLGPVQTRYDTSYLADTVVLMRHFEAGGSVRQCIAVLKKRHGEHEHSIRELVFEDGGLRVGPPLTQFAGVLSGCPRYDGDGSALLSRDEGGDRESPDA